MLNFIRPQLIEAICSCVFCSIDYIYIDLSINHVIQYFNYIHTVTWSYFLTERIAVTYILTIKEI